MSEKNSMRSVLGGLARESRPDLSGPVSILQSRFNKAQVSDIQEINRVVRLQTGQGSHRPRTARMQSFFGSNLLFLMEIPVVEVPVMNKHKPGM